jgi:hypothetical protein
MDDSSNNPADDRSGIVEAIAAALRQPPLLRVMPVLATTAVVFVGMRLAAPILNPILFAVILALLFSPIYAWLRRRGVPTPLALVLVLVGLTIPFWAWPLGGSGAVPAAPFLRRHLLPLCGLDAGDPPRDALACEPYRREWRGHRAPSPR